MQMRRYVNVTPVHNGLISREAPLKRPREKNS